MHAAMPPETIAPRRALIAWLACLALSACATHVRPLPDGRPRFSDLADGTVGDAATGLVWSRSGNLPGFAGKFDGFTWPEALAFVADMNGGRRPNFGHTDWRLPRVMELATLRRAFWVRRSGFYCYVSHLPPDCTTEVPIDPFSELGDGQFWSGTNVGAGKNGPDAGRYAATADDASARDAAEDAWAIDGWGKAVPVPKTDRRRVLPVRGTSPGT